MNITINDRANLLGSSIGGFAGASLSGINPIVGAAFCATSWLINRIATSLILQKINKDTPESHKSFLAGIANVGYISTAAAVIAMMGVSLTLWQFIALNAAAVAGRSLCLYVYEQAQARGWARA